MRVAWLSGGVSSAVAALLDRPDRLVYIDIEDQHPDTLRFVSEWADFMCMELEVLRSEYDSVDEVCRAFGYVNGPGGAKCTTVLKRRVRKQWEAQQTEPLTYVWGLDATEAHRAERIRESMPRFEHEFPLIDAGLTKAEAHGLLEGLGIKRPAMYDMGYRNNNCIGCVKGGMGYWNKIRRDFPDVFERRARMERNIGHSCIKGVFLDELDPDRGRNDEVVPECGIMCELALGGLE